MNSEREQSINYMAIETADIFKHCAPAVRSNIGTCGSVSLCNSTKPATADELDTLFKSDGDYRILEALFMTQIETKACGAVQNSWEDFFLANMRVARKNIQFDSQTRSLVKIRPFILAKQRTPINNVYWRVSDGASNGENWGIKVQSKSGIPADARSFTAGERVYIETASPGGSKNYWQGVVVTSVENGDYVDLVLEPQNGGTAFDSVTDPVTGVLRRGSANVGKSEKYCDNEPGYIDTRLNEYWLEHSKFTLCSSDEFNEFRAFVIQNNPLYRELYDLPEVEENRQRTQAFWSKWFNNLMFGSPISEKQNLNEYTELPTIDNFMSSTGLGFGGTRCAGYKANTIGWLEQLQRCSRIFDAQGGQLDLWSLMDAIYKMMRVRMGVGSAAATTFDLFTDSTTAEIIDRGFIKLFKDVSEDTLRLTQDITRGRNEAFGFQFSSYRLRGKCSGITLNVVTHFGLDDYLAEWNDAGNADQGRAIWLLDMGGLYAAIVETSRKTLTTGRLNDLAAVDADYTCVEETVTKTVTQVGITYAAVLECPQSHLLIHNFSDDIPEHVISGDRPVYDPSGGKDYLYY
jgi:hypothetical protein